MRGYSSTAKTILAPTVAREESAGLPTTEPSRAAWSIQIKIYIILILLPYYGAVHVSTVAPTQ